jgi:hypothetical protein
MNGSRTSLFRHSPRVPRRHLLPLFACLLLGGPSCALPAADSRPDLEAGFAHPPASAAPRTWWHWISGNVSAEGITADLEAMKAIGLGGAQIFTVDQSDVKGPVVFMSSEWRRLVRQAITESDRLGLELAIEDGEGWSESGGPWITPAESMQRVVWSETTVHGGSPVSLALPQPLTIRGYYEDIALLAFPGTRGDGSLADAHITTSGRQSGPWPLTVPSPSPGHPQWLRFEFAQARPASSVRIVTVRQLRELPAGSPPWELQASDDGVTFRKICDIDPRLETTFPEVTSRFFRFWLTALPLDATELVFSEISLGGPRLDKLEARSGMTVDRGANRFDPLAVPADGLIPEGGIVDLTGRTQWDAPPGDWTILRLGHTSTGITNHPASPATVGLECDKLSAAAVTAYLTRGSMGAVVADSNGELGRGLQYIICDSWEAGCENWTPLLREDFRKRWGYDPWPWLAVLSGRVVGSVEKSERFLWDYRRLLADLVAENHYGTMQRFAHQNHLGLYAEAVGIGLPTVADQLQCKGRTDVPMGEFWVGQDLPGRTPYDDTKEAASAAHIYGQNIAAAESFTARAEFGGWAQDPYSLKALGDLEFCLGINRFVFHRYAHQPWLDRKPGMSMGPWGTNFERTNTWWNDAAAWMSYLSRCEYLLQEGRFVADICYFYGEGAPVDVKVNDVGLPPGYDYDACDTEILLQMDVRDGRLWLPSGMSYRALLLPANDRMSLRVAQKLRDLVRAGATIAAPKPVASPSLSDYGAGDQEVQAIAQEVWADCDGRAATEHRFGAGRVVWGRSLTEALGIGPDFSSGSETLRYIHRQVSDKAGLTEIYFVSNQASRAVEASCRFRDTAAEGAEVQLWHPDTGAIETLARYSVDSGGITIPLQLDPSGSVFVIFRQGDSVGRERRDPIVSVMASDENKPASGVCAAGPSVSRNGQLILTEWIPASYDLTSQSGRHWLAAAATLPEPLLVQGKWTVLFPPDLGAPPQVILPQLESWTASAIDGVKFFSGTATYEKEFELPPHFLGAGLRLFLDLGSVKNLARVHLNGQELGILWKEPFRIEITGAAQSGVNRLQIEVTNLWPNRMIGDAYLPVHQRITWASYSPYGKGSPLLPSGLLGPIVIRAAADVACRAR